MEGALLNVMPGDLRTQRLADHPELVELLRRLNRLRRRFLPYFTQGQYHHLEAVTATGCAARLYSYAGNLLVIAVNPGDEPVTATVSVDPGVLGLPSAGWRTTRHALDGTVADHADTPPEKGVSVELGPDDLAIIEYGRTD